jgi:DNA-binding transcriptional ArsR family regulator
LTPGGDPLQPVRSKFAVRTAGRKGAAMSAPETSLLALGDPKRLHLLRLLLERPLSVGEISGVASLGQSLVSHHLAVLVRAGWLEATREGRRRVYRLRSGSQALASLAGWIRREVELPAGWRESLPEEPGAAPAVPKAGADLEDYLL